MLLAAMRYAVLNASTVLQHFAVSYTLRSIPLIPMEKWSLTRFFPFFQLCAAGPRDYVNLQDRTVLLSLRRTSGDRILPPHFLISPVGIEVDGGSWIRFHFTQPILVDLSSAYLRPVSQ